MIFLGKYVSELSSFSSSPLSPRGPHVPQNLAIHSVAPDETCPLYTRGSSGEGSGERLPANQWGSDSLGSVPASSAPAKTIINIKG